MRRVPQIIKKTPVGDLEFLAVDELENSEFGYTFEGASNEYRPDQAT